MTVKSGHFAIIRDSITSLTDDRRIQALIIAFSFGAFLEGAAGFGAPVAITAALLVGLGFKPLYAAGICMVANTAPVSYTHLDVYKRQLQWYLTVKHSNKLHKYKVNSLVNLVDVDNTGTYGLSSLQMNQVQDLSSKMLSLGGLFLVNTSQL